MPNTRAEIIAMILDYTLPDGKRVRELPNDEAKAALLCAAQESIRDTNHYAAAAVKAYGGSVMDFLQYQMAMMGLGDTEVM